MNQTIRPHWGMLLFLSLLMLAASCKKKDYSAKKMPASIGTYVYAYTSGVISRADEVKVRFNAPVASEDEVGNVVERGLVHISPKVSGEAVWLDDRTISFKPANYFSTNQQYKGQVDLNRLFKNVPPGVQTFEFNFQTRPQYFTVQVDGVNAVSNDDWSKQEVQGSIYFTDVEALDKVEELIKASQGNKRLKVNCSPGDKPTEYHFTVMDVQRGDKASEVDITWNGGALDIDDKGGKKVEVPALGDFKVVNARLEKRGDPHILLAFSDPIKADQDMDGLVSISGYTGNLRYTVDGNQVKVYPSSKLLGSKNVTAHAGIRNSGNEKMGDPSVWTISFDESKPAVRMVGKGVILPESKGLIFPFEAVNLNAVEIEIFQIFENNILQFLQTNDLDGEYELNRVGRVVRREKIDLGRLNPNADKSEWTRYAVDLKGLISQEPGAIYQIRLGFLPGYTDYFCGDDLKAAQMTMAQGDEEQDLDENSIMDMYYGPNGYYRDYYGEREDPCKPAYYSSRHFVQRNLLASNLGVTAKLGNDNSMFVAVNDLRDANNVANAKVKAFDYQQQLLGESQTDAEGLAIIQMEKSPHFVVVESGGERSYLKTHDGHALSLSRFDVGGAITQKGLKGFIYGERGVWRPGDTLFLNFILEDLDNKLPQGHPVTMEIYNSRGQLHDRQTATEQESGIYDFTAVTSPQDPTGNWSMKVKVGGATFAKTLKVETIKPNRLKVRVDFGAEELYAGDNKATGSIESSWLHGTPASNLRAKVEMQFQQKKTSFESFRDFVFDDPSRKFDSEPNTVFDGELDADGKGGFTVELNAKGTAPGKLRAGVKSRVFEKGGDFSSDNFSIDYSPYDTYAGVQIKKNRYGEKRLDVGKESRIGLAAVSETGKPATGRKLNVGIYRINWSWWWDADESDLTSYNSASHYGAISKKEATTDNRGEATTSFQVERWGRYLVRVCDEESGHCTGDIFYAGYPWDDGEQGNTAATMLQFSSNKTEYKVGDVVSLSIPSTKVSKGLLTIENGTKVLASKWFSLKEGDNTIKVSTNAEWTPNVYAHVSLIQPHAQTDNDLPIRTYGVVPIKVVDPKTQLHPEIQMADELKPEEEFTVEVKERKGKPMAYTIAVVDEGLLDLTRFRTPAPWEAFYAREALGVKTWDMYDYVLGAYGGELERILSVGGGAAVRKKGKDQAQRFKPVVKHLGPFYLKGGRTAKHTIKMPNYVGSVRTMVVAANSEMGAYGHAEQTTPVRKPLMVLATLPRVLGPGEELVVPVNVFAMDKKVEDVKVSIEASDLFTVLDDKTQSISFSKPGDQLVGFRVKIKEDIGIAKLKITATGAGESAFQEIELDVRNPNPYVTDVYSEVLEAGESWDKKFSPVGMNGTNTGVLEVSNIPPINLDKHLRYLIRYPHGCIEQTTSSGFPQLYAGQLLELSDEQKRRIPENIQATLDRLKLFQVSGGGFSYWPGDSDASNWGSNYAGHFMLEAEKLGYNIPGNMKADWVKYQRKLARSWTFKPKGSSDYGYYNNNDLMQAYRLYTLALAGEPEKGAMNRMRNTKGTSKQARWRLAAAYGLIGDNNTANKIMDGLNTEVKPYQELGYTYGSDLRDKAMILETLVTTGNRKEAARLLQDLSRELSSMRWFSTQTVAYALLGVGKFVGGSETGGQYTFSYTLNGKSTNAGTSMPVMNVDLPVEGGQKDFNIKNTSSGILYARLILTGRPLTGDRTSAENDLKIAIQYKDMDGKGIDPASIEQGTDFYAEVKVTNPSKTVRRYDEMALTQIFPSGWEITNARMNVVAMSKGDKPEYQDIRDDRVYSYFDINSGKTHTYVIQLNAAYQGRFYLPSVNCEAMYDNTISARQPGEWVDVVTKEGI